MATTADIRARVAELEQVLTLPAGTLAVEESPYTNERRLVRAPAEGEFSGKLVWVLGNTKGQAHTALEFILAGARLQSGELTI